MARISYEQAVRNLARKGKGFAKQRARTDSRGRRKGGPHGKGVEGAGQ
jgi:hypothetical protein